MEQKMKRIAALLLGLLLALTPVLAVAEESLDGRWLCPDVEGNVTEETTVSLKDDFGLYVNKDWYLQTQIPDGEMATGTFEDADRTLRDRQIALMKNDSLTGHDAELVRKLYQLTTDWDYRNALGVTPAMPTIEALRTIDSMEALKAHLFDRNNLARYYPLAIGVGADLIDPDVYITQIGTPSLMLSDSAEYTERTQAGDLYYASAQQLGMYMLQKLGFTEAEAEQVIENAFAFEAQMAAHIKPMATHYQADYFASILNYYTTEELKALAGEFPITDVIEAYGFKVGQRFLVTEPDYVAALPEIFTEANVPLIRDWIILKAAKSWNDCLDQQTAKETEAIGNALMGITGETNEDDAALSIVKGLLPVPMDNLYIQAYCSEQQRNDILEIINEVLAYYHTMLEENNWLSAETRAKAIEKLDAIRVNAVYPDQLGDWSDLDFDGPEAGGNLLKVNAQVADYMRGVMSETIDTRVDKTKWDQIRMATAVTNAAYNPQNNSINILAGILSGNFYNEDMTYEQKLGGIGTVIAHEISHAFDTNGSQFDKDGALANWWTEEDYAAFQERAAKLAAWYDGFIPGEGIVYSGQKVQTEAIADMAGMKAILAIAAEKENFDYDAFFRQYAALWRRLMVPAALPLIVAQDTHPLHYLRTNATLMQFDAFLDFYGIQPGDGMYMAPEERVAVW